MLPNCLQMKYIFAIIFTVDKTLVGKMTTSARLNKIHFPKISDQACLRKPLRYCMENSGSQFPIFTIPNPLFEVKGDTGQHCSP